MKNITDHIALSKTVIEMCRMEFQKEDSTSYTDKQVLEFMKSNRMVGNPKEYWKEKREEPLQPQIEWES